MDFLLGAGLFAGLQIAAAWSRRRPPRCRAGEGWRLPALTWPAGWLVLGDDAGDSSAARAAPRINPTTGLPVMPGSMFGVEGTPWGGSPTYDL